MYMTTFPCHNCAKHIIASGIINVYYIEPYAESEILEYAEGKYDKIKEVGIISELCETPGDVDALYKVGVSDLYDYATSVVESVADVSTANALKISHKLAYKDGDEGYPVELFLRAFRAICGVELRSSVADNDIEGQMWYSAGIKISSKYLTQLNITGINKTALFDLFLFDIREEWA